LTVSKSVSKQTEMIESATSNPVCVNSTNAATANMMAKAIVLALNFMS